MPSRLPERRSEVEKMFARIGCDVLALIMVAINIVAAFSIGAMVWADAKLKIPALLVAVWMYACGEVVRRVIMSLVRKRLLPPEG